MNKMILAISIVGALLFAATFFNAPVSMAMEDATFFVQEKCTSCHGMARICSNLDKDDVWWTTTVERMALRGADVEQSQVGNLGVFLSAPDEEFLKACQKK